MSDTYIFQSLPPTTIRGKRRATLNGISFVNPATPIRLADWKNVKGDYKLDFPSRPLTGRPRMDTSIINGTFKGFAEIIFQNNDTVMQSFHIDGFSFYVVGYGFKHWAHFISVLMAMHSRLTDFVSITAWIMVYGQMTAAVAITSGMQLPAVLYRFADSS